MDEIGIVVYDNENDCELRWCELREDLLGSLSAEGVPHSVKAANP